MLKPVRKLALVIVPASSPTNTKFVLTMNAGTSLTPETVSKKLFVVVSKPSFAMSVIVVEPNALVLVTNCMVRFVPVPVVCVKVPLLFILNGPACPSEVQPSDEKMPTPPSFSDKLPALEDILSVRTNCPLVEL